MCFDLRLQSTAMFFHFCQSLVLLGGQSLCLCLLRSPMANHVTDYNKIKKICNEMLKKERIIQDHRTSIWNCRDKKEQSGRPFVIGA